MPSVFLRGDVLAIFAEAGEGWLWLVLVTSKPGSKIDEATGWVAEKNLAHPRGKLVGVVMRVGQVA